MNSDLISRSELKKAYFNAINETSIGEVSIIDIIDNAPTVEYPFYQEAYQTGYEEGKNERPHGEWIEKVERRGCFAGDKTVYSYTCPFCGVKEFKKYPFCHCGADMRGEK